MIADILKKSILQAAIQGKLTKQLPTDGDATDLLKQIHDEKSKLIAVGKLKPEKNLPPIQPDELPFTIPQNWTWCRLGDICKKVTDYVASGSFKSLRENVQYYKTQNFALLVKTADFANNFSKDLTYTDEKGFKFLSNSNLYGGELILSNIGASIGKAFIVPKLNKNMTLAPNSILLTFIFNDIQTNFFYYFVLSPYFQKLLLKVSAGSATPKFSKTDLKNFLIPLPPLAEQERIVARLEKILPEVEALAKAETELDNLQKNFPRQFKNAILQDAIQGKLTKQLSTDGDAKDLLKQIRAEKNKLIAEGKLKPEKPLSPIQPDEIPFDIPQNWTWVRLGEVALINGGYAFKSTNYTSTGFRVIRISDFNENGFLNKDIVRHDYDKTLENFLLSEREILLCMTGGTVGKSLFVEKINEPMLVNQRVAKIKIYVVIEKYIYAVILSTHIQNLIQEKKNSTNDNISMDLINNFLIPLPPLAEQKRIVERLEKLLPLCEI